MRSFVLRNRMNALLKAASIGVLGAAVAGCSSGVERFDHYYRSATPQTANVNNPYPGAVDPTTTASTNGRLTPIGSVAPKPVAAGVYHQAEPTYAQQQPIYNQPVYQQPQSIQAPQQYQPYVPAAQSRHQPLSTYQPTTPSWNSGNQVSASQLPPANTPTYNPPKPDPVRATAPAAQPKPEIVYIAPEKTDPLTTAAVQPANAYQQRVEQGWSTTGATSITARSGETLYNLSKRYGVPVAEIRKANGMSASDSLKSGQRVVIPNYIFSPSAAVSAPDSDPQTRASRASTGYVGEANVSNVAVPTHRPYEVAAISPSGSTQDVAQQRYKPRTFVAPPKDNPAPDYSITTGSISNKSGYTVQSGDSLSKIAAKHGVSVSQLQSANNISGSNIRLGQRLVIPTVGSQTVAAVKRKLPANVDPITTGSISNTSKTKADAPARTGISDFRWPVSGRVVGSFGDKTSNGKNEGIDISVPEGTAVKAAENGVVIYAGSEISSYGKLILIRHSDDWVSAYAHNRDFEVKKGDNVRRGQIIARSGKTGGADRPKLHFELRKNSVPVNPTSHLAS